MKTLEEKKARAQLLLSRQGGILAQCDMEKRDLNDQEAKLYGELETERCHESNQ